MALARRDFTIPQGVTWSQTLRWRTDGTPVNLSGYTARMHVRTTPSAPLAADLSTENGRITLGGVAGTVALNLPQTVTSGFAPRRHVYDLWLYSADGTATRLVDGGIEVSASVTHS